jgi:hypothetical protein
MSENLNDHWTDDDDLVTRFVLGRLSNDERRQLEEHLTTCLRCRQVVQSEQALAAGVRLYGREKLKENLKRHIVAGKRQNGSMVTWQRALSAAAVLVIITGISIYNGWFPGLEMTRYSVSEGVHEQAQLRRAEENAVVPKQEIRQSAPAAKKRSEEESPVRSAPEKSSPDKLQSVQSPGANKQFQLQAESGAKKMERISRARAQGGVAALDKDEANSPSGIGRPEAAANTIWVVGNYLGDSNKNNKWLPKGGGLQENAERRIRTEEVSRQKDELLSSDQVVLLLGLEIVQRSIGDLTSQKKGSLLEGKTSVPAEIDSLQTGARMVLYLRRLVPASALENAVARRISPDSIVVEIESARVGFKLPLVVVQWLTNLGAR